MMALTILVYDQVAYVLTFIYSVYYICAGNYDTSTWPVLLEMSVPFDTTTMYGWYLLLLFAASMDFAYITCMLLSTTQFIGCCMYIVAICNHFESIVQMVDANIEQNRHEKNLRKISKAHAKINAQICDAIQIHIKIYE